MTRRPAARRLAFVVLVAALGAAGPVARAGQGAAARGGRAGSPASAILAGSDYQTTLPGFDGRSPAATGAVWPPGRHGSRERPWGIPVPSGLGALLEILVWIVAGAVALAVIGTLAVAVGRLSTRARGGAALAAAPGPAKAEPSAAPPPPLSAAERLAADGRYGQAAHALLVLALAALGEQRGRVFPSSATSREILASRRLPAGTKVPLEALVAAVERSVFGGAELAREDWDRCRTAYAHLGGAP